MSFIKHTVFVMFALLLVAAVARASVCEVMLSRYQRGESELTLRLDGEPGGYLRYRMIGESEAAVTGMYMHDTAKGRGLSSVLVHGMMLRNPEIRKVGALLVMTNLSASGLLWVRHKITDEQCRSAVANTPFIKVFKKFGFKLSDCYWNPDAAYLEIEMER